MVTLPTNPEEFLAYFAKDIAEQPVLSAADLSRVSRERHEGLQSLIREVPSAGALKLSGGGVVGHEAPLDDVTMVGMALQRLFTAVGASLEGFKNIRGPLPRDLMSKTRLGLRAAPRPGSLILDLSPTISPSDELRSNGEAFNDSDTQLVDSVVSKLSDVIAAALVHEGGAADDTAFSSEVRALGPRAAGALRSFAHATSSSNFNVDMTWIQPLHHTVKFSLSTKDAVWIESIISGRELDVESVTIHGALKTVSHGKKWDILNSEFGNVRIDISEIEGRPWADWNPDDLVEVEASMTITDAPGRPPSRALLARHIRPWDGSLEDIERVVEDDSGSASPMPMPPWVI
ncbi:hypothetical protein [Arthrobacter sp. TMN-50]